MRRKKITLASLEQKGMIQILLTLLDRPEHQANMTQLREATKIHNETLDAKVKLLKALGFVDDIKERGVPGEHKVWLTERGLGIAEILNSGEDYLLSSIGESQTENQPT